MSSLSEGLAGDEASSTFAGGGLIGVGTSSSTLFALALLLAVCALLTAFRCFGVLAGGGVAAASVFCCCAFPLSAGEAVTGGAGVTGFIVASALGSLASPFSGCVEMGEASPFPDRTASIWEMAS